MLQRMQSYPYFLRDQNLYHATEISQDDKKVLSVGETDSLLRGSVSALLPIQYEQLSGCNINQSTH